MLSFSRSSRAQEQAVSAGTRVDSQPRTSPARILRRLKFEATIFLLLVTTFAAIQFQELIVSRTLILTPASTTKYPVYWYGDQDNGGNSIAESRRETPLNWACLLKPGYDYPYCGYGLLFDAAGVGRGLDLSGYQTMRISVSHGSDAETLRIIAKDHNLRYGGKPGEFLSKPNEIEVPLPSGSGEIVLKMADFAAAPWWIAQNKIPAELSGPSFGNIVALEFQPGTNAGLGRHDFRIESISLEGSSLSQAQWYLGLLGFWVLLIGGFLIHRVINLREEFEARHLQQVRESAELQAAKSAAESASRAKSEFLANMSHELRTPLNAILGYAQLLERAQLDEQHALAARTIHRSGAHLLTLITDILDLSRIEAGRLELIAEALDLHACIREVADMMKLRADEKGLQLGCDLSPDLPRFVVGDEKRIRQLLINLVGNAVKFTAQGEVSLRVCATGRDSGTAKLHFEVSDTGPGIPEDRQAQIFEPFEQIGEAGQRAGGTGLGLSISRQIVALMGGDIQVESKVGAGSRFWFVLDVPLAETAAAATASSGTVPMGYRGRRRRILIVDDLEENRAVIVDTLRPYGFDLDEACDGAQALATAEATWPDLVLMDVRMPVMNGLEATRRLRSSASLKAVPVIALSAGATREVEAESLAAGADGFLAKPIEREKLIGMLVRFLKLDWEEGASEATPPTAREAELVAPPQQQMEALLQFAMAGNMRALRTQAREIRTLGNEYQPFADRLEQLAKTYQSPAILRLIERQLDGRRAA